MNTTKPATVSAASSAPTSTRLPTSWPSNAPWSSSPATGAERALGRAARRASGGPGRKAQDSRRSVDDLLQEILGAIGLGLPEEGLPVGDFDNGALVPEHDL